MATSFPGSVDAFPRPTASTNTDDPGFELDVVIDHLSDALEAVEAQVLSGGGWTYSVATSDTANTTTTAVNAAGLSIPALPDGLYEVESLVVCTSGATTTGAQVGVANNATGATLLLYLLGSNGAAAMVSAWPASANYPASAVSLNATSGGNPFVGAKIEGVIRASSMTGTVNVTIAMETGGATVSVKADSFIRYRRVAA